MRFSQGNQPIQALATDSLDDSFTYRVGRWTLRRGFQYFDPEPHNGFVEVLGKNAIPIMQQVFTPFLQSNRLTQLLHRPSRSRVRGDIAMNQASTVMLDDHEYIQLSKGDGHGEDVDYEQRLDVRKDVQKCFRIIRVGGQPWLELEYHADGSECRQAAVATKPSPFCAGRTWPSMCEPILPMGKPHNSVTVPDLVLRISVMQARSLRAGHVCVRAAQRRRRVRDLDYNDGRATRYRHR